MKDKETLNTSTTWYILWIVIHQHVKTITHCIFESINDHNGKIITSRTCSKEALRNTNKIRVKKALKSLLKTLKITNTKNITIPLNKSYVQPCMLETNPYNWTVWLQQRNTCLELAKNTPTVSIDTLLCLLFCWVWVSTCQSCYYILLSRF